MRVLLIFEDGRPEVLEGSFGEELTIIAVLTQAALAALDESAFHARQPKSESVQMMLGENCVTLLRLPESRWLRFEHGNEISINELQQWALQKIAPEAEVKAPSARFTTLMEALNITTL